MSWSQSLLGSALLIEILLLASWNRAYFEWGLPLYRKQIAVPASMLISFPLDQLANTAFVSGWPKLLFHPLSDTTCAFRESFIPRFGRSYFPLMRGVMMLDYERNEVRVVGWCNWSAMLFVGVASIALSKESRVFIPLFLLLFCGSYLRQRSAFNRVVAAVRAQAVQGEKGLAADNENPR